MKKILLSLIFLSLSNAYAMEQSNELVAIETWSEAGMFAGKLVLFSSCEGVMPFETNILFPREHYYSNHENAYAINPNNNLIVALVIDDLIQWPRGELGFVMRRLLKIKAPGLLFDTVEHDCYLKDSLLKGSNLKMREATTEEKAKVIAIVNNEEAKIEGMQRWNYNLIGRHWEKFKSEFEKSN